MNRIFGFGIIGAGAILYFHALAVSALNKRARLIGIADLDKNNLRRSQGRYFVPFAYTDHRDLLAREDIDIIVIATPPSTHEQFVLDALRAGKHVMCEKPLAHTLESADRIIEASAKYNRKVTVCYQERYISEVQRMIWLKDNGWIGNLQFGHFERMTPPSGATPTPWWGKWDIAGGGAVITQFIHQLDAIIKIFGNPVLVLAEMDTLYRNIESEDTFAAIIRFENGAIVNCSCSLNAHRTTTRYDIIGDSASVHLPWAVYASDTKYLKSLKQAMVKSEMLPQGRKGGLLSSVTNKIKDQLSGDGLPVKVMRKILPKFGIKTFIGAPPLHMYLTEAFMDAIEHNREVPVSIEDARRSLELCVAIYSSALTGKVIQLPINSSNSCYNGITSSFYNEHRRGKK